MNTKSWITLLVLVAVLKINVSHSCGLKDPCLNPPTAQPTKNKPAPSSKPSSRPVVTTPPSTVRPPAPPSAIPKATSLPTNNVEFKPSTSPTIKNEIPSQQPTTSSMTSSSNSPTAALTRITFIDGSDGLWSTLRASFYSDNPIIECPIDGTVVFHYPNYYHDVTAMASEQHYNNCDFQDSTVLAPLIQNADFGSVTYYHNCTTPGKIEYLSCSIPGHCEAGQKIMVKTSSTVKAQDEVTGEWLLHVHSLNQVLRILGQRYDPSTGFLILDRGFQTEQLADQTLDWIWCGLDHCPSFVDIWPNATLADCTGAVYSLMGYVSRKRPVPQWSKAEYYYNKAIDTKGMYECDARSYLTELYLQKGDYETAVLKAGELCGACGKGDENDPYGNSVRQVKSTFDSLGVEWPTSGPCASDITELTPTPTNNIISHPSQNPTMTPTPLTPTVGSDNYQNQTNLTRITFIDGSDGLWSTLRASFYRDNPIIECPIEGTVVFHYPNYYHDVTAMASEQHYNNCDFQDSTVLAPLIQNADFGSVTYYHNCTTPGKIEYLSCSIPGHCEAGQKIMVKTSSTVKAQDEVTGEWLLHVHSLNQVLRILGQRYDPSTGFLILDRGFQTEQLADQTLDWIWCGLDHCPSFVDIWPNATLADCTGAVYSLMGYVSRKRPVPQWSKAEYYYNKAIDTKGMYECDARSYLTELYLQKGDYETAVLKAGELCGACGKGDENDPYGNSVRQVKSTFASLGVEWPTSGLCGTETLATSAGLRIRHSAFLLSFFPFMVFLMFL